MTWLIPLTKNHFATLLSVYAPTLDADENAKDAFHECLNAAICKNPSSDKLMLMDDFSGPVGSNAQLWEGVMGTHGIGKLN